MNLKNQTFNKNKTSVGVGFPEILYLNEFGSQLWSAFDEVPYHVGSSLTKTKWRDVDVRVLLSDEIYSQMGFGNPNSPHSNAKWVAYCMAFSELGKRITGLPIDFQIQTITKANELYSSKNGHRRSALGITLELRNRDFKNPESKAVDYLLKNINKG
jgi:hypothetical protein